MNGYVLFVSLLGACVSLVLASGKGRSVPGWAALGFIFPLLAIIAVWLLKPITQKTLAVPHYRLGKRA